jgi:hypothetical protein
MCECIAQGTPGFNPEVRALARENIGKQLACAESHMIEAKSFIDRASRVGNLLDEKEFMEKLVLVAGIASELSDRLDGLGDWWSRMCQEGKDA